MRAWLACSILALGACATAVQPSSHEPSTEAVPPKPPAEATGALGSAKPSSTTGAAPVPAPTEAPIEPADSAPTRRDDAPPGLTTFRNALRELEGGNRQQHVRVVWLGDSHAAADFWSGELRRQLQKRFGDAGPGFVHLGLGDARHEGVRSYVHGSWRQRPKAPARTKPWGDGAFGLGGMLTAGYAGHPRATVSVAASGLAQSTLVWDLCYKMSSVDDALWVQLEGGTPQTIEANAQLGQLHHVTLRATRGVKLTIRPTGGRPELCGTVVETDPAEQPGVVLDNLGINGARYGTALAWDATAWEAELGRRNPELVVIEYGGNEASDLDSQPAEYASQLQQLIERVRRVRTDASCLVIGLADRVDAPSRIVPIRDAQRQTARAAGCEFWDLYEEMGGEGSMRRWRDQQLAAPDGVHLTRRGYRRLAASLLEDLVPDTEMTP